MKCSVSFVENIGLASASIAPSAAAEDEYQNDPQAVFITSAFASPVTAASATAEEKDDDPQTTVVSPVIASTFSAKSVIRITAASAVCST